MHCSSVFFYLEKYSSYYFWTIVQCHLFYKNDKSGISVFCTSVSSDSDVKTIIRLRENTNKGNMHNLHRLPWLYIFIYFKKGKATKKRAKSLELLTHFPYTSHLLSVMAIQSDSQIDIGEPLISLYLIRETNRIFYV